jgi:UDP-hydrolysing UDP-N-acetyl-D-glucosamine 2-epimerase
VRQDFPEVPIEEVWSTYEGSTLLTSAKETGALLSELGTTLCRMRPALVVVCADRHEVVAAAQAARYLHLPLLHLQGGERSGSVDDRCRDAISALADVHCVCTQQAKLRVYSLTGDYDAIHVTGCPSIDLAKDALSEPPVTTKELGGAGWTINVNEPFVVVLQHPVTNEVDQAGAQMQATLDALKDRPEHLVVLWPGQDAGADAMSKVIRGYQSRVHTVRSLPPKRFLRLLTQCDVLVGNSSAGIREASYLGVPVVNVGTRQIGRERAKNVIDVGYDAGQIARAVQQQIAHGPYPSSTLYGHGDAGEKIAEVIVEQRVSAHSRAQRV